LALRKMASRLPVAFNGKDCAIPHHGRDGERLEAPIGEDTTAPISKNALPFCQHLSQSRQAKLMDWNSP
jgi:hypothetical protein